MIERERFLTGEEVDLSAEDDRVIPASLLEGLISGPNRELPAALRIKGAIIEGKLTLRFVTIAHEVMIRDCEFTGELNCRGTRFQKSAHFTNCTFRDAYFERARVNGTLLFNDSTFKGVCSLLDAVVEDNVVATKATFDELIASRLRVAKSLVCSGSTFNGKTHLLDAHIGATAEFEAVELAEIDASRMSVGGVAFFRTDKKKPAIIHGRATFKLGTFGLGDFAGAVFESEADFTNCSFGKMASFGSLIHDATLFRTIFQRKATFIGARSEGWFIFAGARFDRDAVFESCRAGWVDFRPVLFDGAVVHVWFRGDARFYGFVVDGSILFNAAMFEGDAFFGAIKVGLNAGFEPVNDVPVRVRGDFALDDASIGGSVHARGLEVDGRFSLSGTRVEQGVALESGIFGDATFIGASVRTILKAHDANFGREVTFDGLMLPGTLRLTRVRAERIRMVHAEIGGTVELPEVVAQQINLWGAHVKHDVRLMRCDVAVLRLGDARVDGAVNLSGAQVWGAMDCSDARVGALVLDDAIYGDTRLPVSIDMRRFTFASLSGDGDALLARSDPFDRDAYIRIEGLHRTRGEDAEARHVYSAMRKRATNIMWQKGERLRAIFNVILDGLFQYGARPARLLLWSMLFIALGTFVFSPQHPGALLHKDYPKTTIAPRLTDAVIVSAKLFVPTPDLAPSEPFVPANNAALYALVHRICGAIIVPVGVLFLTGLFFRR